MGSDGVGLAWRRDQSPEKGAEVLKESGWGRACASGLRERVRNGGPGEREWGHDKKWEGKEQKVKPGVRFGFREEEFGSRRDVVGACRAQGDTGVGTPEAKVRNRSGGSCGGAGAPGEGGGSAGGGD